MRRALMTAFVLWLAAAVLGLTVHAPVTAAAAALPPWYEGTAGHPFSLREPVSSAVEVLGDNDQRLQLARLPLTDLDPNAPTWDEYPSGKRPDPRMAYPLSDGHVLISGGKDMPFVKEVDRSGKVVWEYHNGTDGLLRKTFSAEPATFGGRRCVLISDRIACRVFAVTRDDSKDIVWQYGTTDEAGPGVNQLADPFCATQIPATAGQTNGNVLIADSNDNHRVIEVRADDYDAGAADLGYSAVSVVWQYGVTGQVGSAPGYLNQARSPQRLPGGDTLITDAEGKRIIRVRSSDYDPTKPANGYDADSIVWKYENGVDGPLRDPNTARFVTGGSLAGTVIVTDCDGDSQWVRLIDYGSKQVEDTIDLRSFARPSYVSGTDASSPRDARVDDEGALWIADAGFGRVLRVGNEGTGTVTSEAFDCGRPSMVKAFAWWKLEFGDRPAGTKVSLEYSMDGKGFKTARVSSDGKIVDFPPGAAGTRFAYRITLTTRDRWATPVLEGFSLHYMKATTGGAGGGGGGDNPGGSGNSGGSGVFRYPATAAGGTGTYGTGTGSGSYGTGTGSGGSGAGTGISGADVGSSAAAGSLQPPVQSTGNGAPQAVQGYQTEGAQGVSGVPLLAAEGAQAPTPAQPGPPVPVLALIGAGLVIAAAFFVPWPFAAAQIRDVVGFDHTRPKFYRPFWPLGR